MERETSRFESPSARRNRWEITISVLEVASKGIRLTRLMYKANVDYRGLQRYLKFLDKHGYVDITSTPKGERIIKTTDKGNMLLQKLLEVKKVLPENSTF